MDDRDTFARNLTRLRNERGLSQEELASRVGLHRTMITGYECRKHSPKWKNVVRIAAVLGVTVDELAKP
ncbi:MAG: XRE family transcriptional regulator [Rhizobium sp.]|nr:MAG: XRE family transcriptional regulator [Rhizobium sp.]